MRRRHKLVLPALVLALAAAAVPVYAQKIPPARPAVSQLQAPPVSPDPQNTTASFGDWVLRCQRTGEGAQAQRSCEIVQTLQIAGQGPIAQIAFGRAAGSSPLKVTVLLPHNVTVSKSVTLGLGEKDAKPVDLVWRRCLPAGCLADADLPDEALKRWRGEAGQGRLKFLDAAGREAVLPFSFRGLAQGLDSLAKA